MDRRRIREGSLSFAMTNAHKPIAHTDESEDEFYDCADEEEKSKTHYAPWDKPEGRLSKLNDMKLVECDEPLYVPITQEPVPKTEDQLEDDAEVMLKLGPGSGEFAIVIYQVFDLIGLVSLLQDYNLIYSYN